MADTELIEIWVNDYLEELANHAIVEAGNPKSRSPRPAIDINQFYEIVGQAITTQQRLEGVEKNLIYSSATPENDDNIAEERIVYSLVERKPGLFEQKSTGSVGDDSGRRQRMKMFREGIRDPDNPGMAIYTYGQWFDNIVEFKIFARTNDVADSRALWFEDMMDLWHWYFRASGISQFKYLGRLSDEFLSPDNRKVVCRPLRYYVRTEKVTVVRENMLRSLVVQSSVQ